MVDVELDMGAMERVFTRAAGPGGGAVVRSFGEKLREEGKIEGRQEGLRMGEREGRRDVTRRVLDVALREVLDARERGAALDGATDARLQAALTAHLDGADAARILEILRAG